jgi:glycosyltransferase involved in cell wall biosynthesis
MTPFSLIVTVLNEGKTITALLKSIAAQTYQPHELIIVDGGSTDTTVEKIAQFCRSQKWSTNFCQVFVQPGNRSVGRNAAIAAAKCNWIAITDAGCELDTQWLASFVTAISQDTTKAQVLAGYYAAQTETAFQRAAAPFFLVMPDQVNPSEFLPATRSMALTKEVWQKYGGFPEEYSDNEDYVFAKKLQDNQEKIKFVKDAVVRWQPPRTVFSFTKTLFRFARGDAAARIWRPKVGVLFLRYMMGVLGLIALTLMYGALVGGCVFVGGVSLYSLLSIAKLYRYTKKEWHYVPLLQYCADGAVMTGSIVGYFS